VTFTFFRGKAACLSPLGLFDSLETSSSFIIVPTHPYGALVWAPGALLRLKPSRLYSSCRRFLCATAWWFLFNHGAV